MYEIFWIVALLAVIAGTLAGFGSSTIFLPAALFFFDFNTALIIVAILHISGNIGKITFFRASLNKRLLLLFGIPSIIFTIVGATLVEHLPQPFLRLLLGLFLLAFVTYSFAKPNTHLDASPRNNILGGSLSGFFAGLIGTGGAIRGAFLASFDLKKNTYIATASVISLAVDITRIPIYLNAGFLQPAFYEFIPILFIIAILGSYIGKKLVNKIPQEAFRKVVLISIALVSLKFIYEGI